MIGKSTKLQAQLRSHYDSSRNNLGENSEYLRAMSKIAGKQGLSHEKRIERVGNWLDTISSNLNYFEKSHVNGMLDSSEIYVSQNASRIKNSGEVLRKISTLKQRLDYDPVKDFNQQREILESGTLYIREAEPTTPIQIKDYRSSSQSQTYNRRFLRRAGKGFLEAVAYVGIGAVLFVAGKGIYEWGQSTQQPKIKQQEAVIKDHVQKERNYRESLEIKDGIINKKDDKIAIQGTNLLLAENIKEKARQEAIQNTTTKYESDIEAVKRQAQAQVDELLKQQENQRKDLEGKLAIAGRPDEEVRQSVTQELTKKCEEEKANALTKIADTYLNRGAQDVYATQVPDNTTPNVSTAPVISSVVDANHSTVVDYRFIEEGAWPGDRQEYSQRLENSVESSTIPITTAAENNTLNVSWEERMAVVGEDFLKPTTLKEDCGCSKVGIKEREYLDYKFMGYPREIGKNAKKNWENGKLIPFLCSSFGAIVATANDAVEFAVVRPAAGTVRGLGGGISRGLGNKNDGLEHGWDEGNKFGASLMDDVYGGVSKNTFDSELLKGKFKEAFRVPYCMEDTKTKGHIKLGGIIFSDILPWVWGSLSGHHGHHHAGGFDRDGGPVDGELGRGGGVVK